MSFPWMDTELDDRSQACENENLARIGQSLDASEATEICHGIASRPEEAYSDFPLRERKHFTAHVKGNRASLDHSLTAVDDGTSILGDKVMHITRVHDSQFNNIKPQNGILKDNVNCRTSFQTSSAAMTSSEDNSEFGVRKWRRSKRQVTPTTDSPAKVASNASSRLACGESNLFSIAHDDGGKLKADLQSGTFRSAGHIAGYTGHISQSNPVATSIDPSGRQKRWSKDLLVQNHREKISGYAGFQK